MTEYKLTYARVTTKLDTPADVTPPEGDGWTIHSWHPDHAHPSVYMFVMWERPSPKKEPHSV